MAKPLVVEIPHQIGRAEARRRIEARLGQGRELVQKAGLTMQDPVWDGDTLAFVVGAMGQTVSGTIAVEDRAARVEVRLPLLLGVFSAKVREVIAEKGGELLAA
ncbi:Putative polyhydroxyalkanoic acid system protein (PHA_gran_rgn) [Methylobacterium sp. 174MFSha1.1]|uniref:polyhydroxyalkanoic acid system family protein n=1 Tax=Methylobacterium sp. 174MFSha1.1 TaxID=1502749 RepID=UPI0008EC3A05|nr:polyhydroxyalkanoic acid system family protein [Methylobacterium sp. 174MFSha1.1]SFU42131.1 Putative polyhydroxyalkanoic acid system protein (PHA_gran_rgn) [Methylobacterium sp. 174MFSha1.1]